MYARSLQLSIIIFMVVGLLGCGSGGGAGGGSGGGAGDRSLSGRRLTMAPALALESQFMFAHDNFRHIIAKIDVSTALATTIGPTTFYSTDSALSSSRGVVPGPDGQLFPPGTHFGLLRDRNLWKDFLVVIDTVTGEAVKIVESSRPIVGRGISFGPDGVTLFLMEVTGDLSIVDTVTGMVTLVGNTGYPSGAIDFDPDTGTFYAFSETTLINIDPSDASTTLAGPPGAFDGMLLCTLARSPEGKWYTVNRAKKELVIVDIDTGGVGEIVGRLGPGSSPDICGSTFAPVRRLSGLVPVDIKPGSCPNPFNLKSRGVLPVAILGMEGLDVATIDPSSVRLLGVPPLRSAYGDVSTPFELSVTKEYSSDCSAEGPDGFTDLTLKFDRQEVVRAMADLFGEGVTDGAVLSLSLTGELFDEFGSTPWLGEDIVTVLEKP